MPTKLESEKKTGTVSNAVEKASLIYEYGHISASSLLAAFDDLKAKRGKPRGVLTDQEQDVLRAVLVMCCAALDGALKQLIRDALPLLLRFPEVASGFEKFLAQRLAGKAIDAEFDVGSKFLAKVLASPQPRERLIEEYVRELTGESLQSAEQVFGTAAALGAKVADVGLDVKELKRIFDIRNKIIHELDIDLGAKYRVRRLRGQDDLLTSSSHILNTARSILRAVDDKLK